MALEGTRAWLQQRVAAYDSPAALEELALGLAVRLEQGAPNDTGTLAEAISEIGNAERTPQGWQIGVGNAERTGEPTDSAPEGTIEAFLDSPEGQDYRTQGVSNLPGWDKSMAWWFLPSEGKLALQMARMEGQFGGPSYFSGAPARYYYVQSADFPAWQQSASAAGLDAGHWTKFTTTALEAWRGTVDAIIRSVLGGGR